MNAIELVNAEIGTVSSRQDGSVAFRVISAELRPSEAGLVLQYHGKACSVTIRPHEGVPEQTFKVNTERAIKTPGSRLRAVLFLLWKSKGEPDTFDGFYDKQMNVVIEEFKSHLPDQR